MPNTVDAGLEVIFSLIVTLFQNASNLWLTPTKIAAAIQEVGLTNRLIGFHVQLAGISKFSRKGILASDWLKLHGESERMAIHDKTRHKLGEFLDDGYKAYQREMLESCSDGHMGKLLVWSCGGEVIEAKYPKAIGEKLGIAGENVIQCAHQQDTEHRQQQKDKARK